ncbi:MAG: uroporphyrinogen-III C-methyltransferase, partial [Candidatus Omnitrophota bacterium]
MKKGKVYLIGAGPAGKDLITARGLEILREAEVVVYDYLVDKELLQEVPPDAELIYCGHSARHVESTNVLVVNRAKAGKKVVRLKNGDPFIFGRAAEEITALLKNQIE